MADKDRPKREHVIQWCLDAMEMCLSEAAAISRADGPANEAEEWASTAAVILGRLRREWEADLRAVSIDCCK